MNTSTPTPDPDWRPLGAFTDQELPASVRRWLLDEGSLTARLISASENNFRVQRLRQEWQLPLPSEQRLLGLGQGQQVLVREVALRCHEVPWVFARSVIPAGTLEGELHHLRDLQNESLGALLFRDPRLSREPFELSQLAGQSPYIDSDLHQQEPAWGRRSRFELQGKSLMVSEVFLAPFRPWPAEAGTV